MLDNEMYLDDVQYVANLNLPYEKLHNSSMIITGATGLIGTFFIDVLMYKNINEKLNCKIYAVGRSLEKAKERFENYLNSRNFEFISHNINLPFNYEFANLDYIIHMASNTHPRLYASDPVGTIASNIIGTNNLLELAVKSHTKRFCFLSSCEIYGENRGDEKYFDEKYCGYIDSNTLRAGYPESKRCGEALCQAYKQQYNLDIVIPRLTRTYGPTVLKTDSKAISQFLHKAINGEDIVLKSEGNQYYSYTYLSDAVSGLLTVLLKGSNGEAYNISDKSSDITLKDLANLIASNVNKKVIFEIPEESERIGYSKATISLLNGAKIKELCWAPRYNIEEGINRTICILKNDI